MPFAGPFALRIRLAGAASLHGCLPSSIRFPYLVSTPWQPVNYFSVFWLKVQKLLFNPFLNDSHGLYCGVASTRRTVDLPA